MVKIFWLRQFSIVLDKNFQMFPWCYNLRYGYITHYWFMKSSRDIGLTFKAVSCRSNQRWGLCPEYNFWILIIVNVKKIVENVTFYIEGNKLLHQRY